ncbi:hypothetical protein [Prevotella koreensis]|uniref:hypothetical protein n=1 Tax=Prevotella koreensis TaxID=2490854 RepID=UPI0028EB363F|nr:hypothetical protein [Prevotella koreensis]
MTIEDSLKTNFGNKNPFRVPEDYFVTLEKRVMDRMPERKTPQVNVAVEISMWKKLRKYVAVAACTGIVIGGYVMLRNGEPAVTMPADNNSSVAANNDYYIDKAVDYVMMENEDFYAYFLDE